MKKTLTMVAILALVVTMLPAAFAQTSDQTSPSSSTPAASSPAASPSDSPAQTSPAQTSPSTPDQSSSAQGSASAASQDGRSEEHTSELQSRLHLVCRLLLEKKKTHTQRISVTCCVYMTI